MARWDLLQRRMADACRADPLHPYIGTEQTVYDLDLVRRSLGEATFNFYGVSYGTWLGAWYGATYPDQVGRMLLDAPMDFNLSTEDNYLLSMRAEQQRFDRRVTTPALADPVAFGLGANAAAVRAVHRSLTYRVARAWVGQFNSPASLIAASAMSDWLIAEPSLSRDAMKARIAGETFRPATTLNDAVRDEGQRMLEAMYTPITDDSPSPLSPMSSMLVAVPCNDTPGTSDAGLWAQVIGRYARDYLAGNSADLMNPCIFWHGPNSVKPPITQLARAGRLMILTSEFDVITPIDGAVAMVNPLPNASMLVLRGSERHGLFTLTDEACIERTGARFLLDGRSPSEQLTECHVDRAAVAVPRFASPVHTKAWRDRLSRWFDQRPRLQRGAL